MGGSKYLAATYWPNSEAEVNEAAYTLPHAGWYEANLQEAPFNFPKPLKWCANVDLESNSGKRKGRSRLGIWRLKDLQVTAEDIKAASPSRFPELDQARLPRQVHMDY